MLDNTGGLSDCLVNQRRQPFAFDSSSTFQESTLPQSCHLSNHTTVTHWWWEATCDIAPALGQTRADCGRLRRPSNIHLRSKGPLGMKCLAQGHMKTPPILDNLLYLLRPSHSTTPSTGQEPNSPIYQNESAQSTVQNHGQRQCLCLSTLNSATH